MRRYLHILLILLSSVLFHACDKPAINVNNNGSGSTIMTATVNGYGWYALTGYAQKDASSALSLFGQYDQNNTMQLYIYPYNGPGSYGLNGLTKISFTQNGISYSSINGQINVTADNTNYIQGNFNGEVVSNGGSTSLIINNGQFNIPRY